MRERGLSRIGQDPELKATYVLQEALGGFDRKLRMNPERREGESPLINNRAGAEELIGKIGGTAGFIKILNVVVLSDRKTVKK